MEQNIAQQDKSIDNQLPSNSGGGKNRKILVGIAVVVLLLLIVIAIRSSVILVNKKRVDQTASKCASESEGSFVKTSSAQLANTKYRDLDVTVKEIKNLSNYYNYPNCNYIVAVNALNFGNTKEANDMYIKLIKLDYGAISPLLKAQTSPNTLEYVRKQIELIEIQTKQNQQNFTATGRSY